MDEKMSIEDINMRYVGSVVFHNNRPVFFVKINNNRDCLLFDISSQSDYNAEFDERKFKPPACRIGFVNLANGSCVYMQRNPVRKYKIGFSSNNTFVSRTLSGRIRDVSTVLADKGFADALLNKYPTILSAYRKAVGFGRVVAFDKQFAVDETGVVYYKGDRKGFCACKNNVIEIIWDSGQEYLNILLDKNHEKAFKSPSA